MENSISYELAHHFTDEWLIEMNMVSPEMINRMRMAIMVAFPVKKVYAKLDHENSMIIFEVAFKFWASIFKGRKYIRMIARELSNKFHTYKVEVKFCYE